MIICHNLQEVLWGVSPTDWYPAAEASQNLLVFGEGMGGCANGPCCRVHPPSNAWLRPSTLQRPAGPLTCSNSINLYYICVASFFG